MYWLSVDQILPRPSPFRVRYSIDWTWVDSQKLFTESYMQAFLWRSTHGKLYGRSDLYRFGYTQDETCDNCNHPRQTTEHLFLQCPPVLSLITQFEEHLGFCVNPRTPKSKDKSRQNPNFHRQPVLATFTSMTVLPSQSS
jgi:hypothetical protein